MRATLNSVINWIFSHKIMVFIVIPGSFALILILYVLIIYLSWLSDRDEALEKLARYKRLIDRTEEMREGMIYAAGDYGLEEKVVDLPTSIVDRNGELVGQFFSQKREIVPYNYIPDALIKSVLASEDRDFYDHTGVNPRGILRAFLVNLKNFRIVQGGSTITQQLGKVLFTDMERNLKRKIYEVFCAREIETYYDKQDILSMYLNLIYFGNGAYGVEAASKMFFGKSVKTLNETECAMIVATISSPRSYSPLSNLPNSVRKTRRILQSMVDAGFMEAKRAEFQYDKFLNKWDVQFDENDIPTSSLIGSFAFSTYRINRAPFLIEQIRRLLVEKFGEEVLKKGGLTVHTTIDAEYQDYALAALRSGVEKQREYHRALAKKYGNKPAGIRNRENAENIQGALIAVHPGSGEVLAYVGGYEFTSKSQLDHIVQIRRQPGSSIKPLLYCSAIENRDITPSTMFIDEPTTFEEGYSPQNYGNSYRGPVIVLEALKRSINVIAVKILEKTGYDTVFNYIRKGLDLNRSEFNSRFHKTLSFALGTYELSPMENVTLHSMIVNGGKYVKPYTIKTITDYSGRVIWNNEEEVYRHMLERQKEYGNIIDPIAAAITVSLAKNVFKPGGTAAGTAARYRIDFPAGGKTGTSTNYNDAWFVGYTAEMVTAVWVGNSKGAISLGRGRSGGSVAAPVWGEFSSKAFAHDKPGEFSVPQEGVSFQTIDLKTGQVPRTIEDPSTVSVDQIFYEGSEPGLYSDEFSMPESESDEEE
ncbi:MAG: PBP1A family penicillin-binding protein [Spirochaetes bacterium]|jgi:1A family penicillin-binding protein|nr:PBP1A family penicillin-binding protein [Spirochaetota bacterium]